MKSQERRPIIVHQLHHINGSDVVIFFSGLVQEKIFSRQRLIFEAIHHANLKIILLAVNLEGTFLHHYSPSPLCLPHRYGQSVSE